MGIEPDGNYRVTTLDNGVTKDELLRILEWATLNGMRAESYVDSRGRFEVKWESGGPLTFSLYVGQQSERALNADLIIDRAGKRPGWWDSKSNRPRG